MCQVTEADFGFSIWGTLWGEELTDSNPHVLIFTNILVEVIGLAYYSAGNR